MHQYNNRRGNIFSLFILFSMLTIYIYLNNTPKVEASDTTKVDLYILIDVSETITRYNDMNNIMREIINSILDGKKFEIGDRVSIKLVAGVVSPFGKFTVGEDGNNQKIDKFTQLEEEKVKLFNHLNDTDSIKKLKTSLTSIEDALKDLKSEIDKSNSDSTEERNCSVLLISDGWNDVGKPDKNPPLAIEDEEELEIILRSIFKDYPDLQFYMFHILSSSKKEYLYKHFWKDDARLQEMTRCSGQYQQIHGIDIIKSEVRSFFSLLRKSHKINIDFDDKSKDDKVQCIIYSNADCGCQYNMVWVRIHAESTLNRNVILTYEATFDKNITNVHTILPNPARIIIPANSSSPYSIPIGINGKTKGGDKYNLSISFKPDQGNTKILSPQKAILITTVKDPGVISYKKGKKGTIVFPTILFWTRENIYMNVTFWKNIPEGITKVDKIDFKKNGTLPKMIEPSGSEIPLKEDVQTIPFGFSRSDIRSDLPLPTGIYKGNLTFEHPPYYRVVEKGKENIIDSNEMDLKFYNPSIWYKLLQSLWVLTLIFLLIIIFSYSYIYCYVKRNSNNYSKSIFSFKTKVDSKKIIIIITVLAWLLLFLIWRYIIPLSYELTMYFWLAMFAMPIILYEIWVKHTKPLFYIEARHRIALNSYSITEDLSQEFNNHNIFVLTGHPIEKKIGEWQIDTESGAYIIKEGGNKFYIYKRKKLDYKFLIITLIHIAIIMVPIIELLQQYME